MKDHKVKCINCPEILWKSFDQCGNCGKEQPRGSHTKQSKPLRTITSRVQMETEENTHHREANPDVLSEEDNVFYKPQDEYRDIKLDLVKTSFPDFSARQQEIIRYTMDGYTLDEISTFLGVSKGTVQTLLHRTRGKMKRKFEKYLKNE